MLRTWAVRGFLAMAMLLASPTALAQITTWDAARDFSGAQNPNAPWTYGWKASAGAALNPFPAYQQTISAYPGRDAWQDLGRSDLLGVYHNTVGVTGDIPTNMLLLQPAVLGDLAVVEWTAPANMALHIQGIFQSLDSATAGVTIVSSASGTRFSASVNGSTPTSAFGLFLNVATGEKIDFVVSGGAAGVNVVISKLSVLGNATIQSIALTDTRLRVTPSAIGQVGGGWTFSKQRFTDGFDTAFMFQISQLGGPGADGFAFVIQNASTTALTGGGGELGYSGIPASLAVEFDTFQNTQPGWNDPNGNHISVHTLGINPNSAMETASIGVNSSIANLKDGNWHLVHIRYSVQPTPKLSIYMDNLTTPVLAISVDIVSTLQLADGSAWIGFTGATGGYTEVHDIRDWHFVSFDLHPPVLSLPSNISLEGNALGGATVSFAVSALDGIDGSRPVTCSRHSGDLFPIGITTVNCSATDLSGNTASGSFTVTVSDTTAPDLVVPLSVNAAAVSSAGAPVSYIVSASDIVDGDIVPACTPTSGSTFPLGTTTVTCTATDHAGNHTSKSFSVVVGDTTPPAISCGAPDGLWHSSDIAIACTASDSGSGLANPADAAFLLATSVPAGGETANAATGSRNVCDAAGNCATAGPIAGNKIDKRAPGIAINAPASAVYLLNQPLTASYSCSDGGSGVASCSGPVANGAAISTASPGAKTFNVNASDNVGNASSLTISYSVGYNLCLLGGNVAKQSNSVIPVRLALCDYAGRNVSSPDLQVTATAVVDGSGAAYPLLSAGHANPGMRFRYLGGAYTFELKTTGLGPGMYHLLVSVSGDPTAHALMFQVSR